MPIEEEEEQPIIEEGVINIEKQRLFPTSQYFKGAKVGKGSKSISVTGYNPKSGAIQTSIGEVKKGGGGYEEAKKAMFEHGQREQDKAWKSHVASHIQEKKDAPMKKVIAKAINEKSVIENADDEISGGKVKYPKRF